MATQAVNEDIFRFEGFTLDLRRGCLRAGDREIELRPKCPFQNFLSLLNHLDSKEVV